MILSYRYRKERCTMLRAVVQPVRCDNPDHPKGCPFGSRWVHCEEHEAQSWLASIEVGGTVVWSVSNVDSETRETATTAMLRALETGIHLP